MMDGDDRSDSGDEGNPRGFSQESSDLLPLSFLLKLFGIVPALPWMKWRIMMAK